MPLPNCRKLNAGVRPSIRNSCNVIATISGATKVTATAVPAKPASFSVLWCWYQAAICTAEWFGDCGGRTPLPNMKISASTGNTNPHAVNHSCGL